MPDELEGTQGTTTPETTSNVPSDPFDAIANETKAEIEADDKPEPVVDDKPAEDDDESDAGSDADDDKGEEAEEDDSEAKTGEEESTSEDGDDKPDADEPQEPTVAEQLLTLMRDPKLLNDALEAAGVATLQELPIFKEFAGRERQSARDETRAEMQREALEARMVVDVLESGTKAVDDFVTNLEKIAKQIEEADPDQPLEIDFPSAQSVKDVAESFAKSRVASYHNENFLPISEYLYGLIEFQGIDPEKSMYIGMDGQQHSLADANGLPPAEWLDAHLQVGRSNLVSIAQGAVQAKAQETIETERKVLQAANKSEIERLTKKFEKDTATAVKKAKDDARAEALAEFASKGAPPRLVNKDGAPDLSDDDVDGDDFDSIASSVSRSLRKSAGGV